MTTLNLQVGANNDDAHESDSSANFHASLGYIKMTASPTSGYRYNGGFRFTTVTVPKAATIGAASVQVYLTSASYDSPDVDILANDVDDAADFSDEADVTSRARTAASESWVDADLGTGWKTSPEIATVIKEIVDREGWASGNALCILIDGTTAAKGFYAEDYGYPERAAKLDIDYTAGAEGVTVFAALATASALSYASTVTAGLVIAGALATATALALAAKHVNSIPAAVATATAKSYEATVTGAAKIAAALATATAKSYAATISAGDAVISAAVATASALAYAATHVNTIPAAVSTATAKSLAATVSGVAIVAGALATATAKSYDATVSGAALIGAALSTAAAKSYAAVVNPGVVVSAAVATASALVRAATIAAESAAGVTSSFLRWLR